MKTPTLYFSENESNTFFLSAYKSDSEEWENNHIELKAVWFRTTEAAFNTLRNIMFQAGVTLLKD